ncbi:epoxide hydrolase family protein [Phytomonospora endophytica]|uniref:epoxide hydrolase family protein n=1 Tax=Phytomonospora endophytica TaxID=714109 RepID=UPI001943DD3B|nr:epoxide hydrolase family protein [Phytomonospora endophytica]
MRPYRIEIPQADIDELRARLARTRWTDEVDDAGDDYGIGLATARRLAEYWADGYDWRAQEARVNAHPQFVTEIDGATVHFLHVRSPEPDATPLILTHGWPGSIVEFLDVIGPLSDPRAHGGTDAPAFHLVIPSIPGFGPSGPTRERGWSNARVAGAFAELMSRLGYERYGAQGGDWGSGISQLLAVTAPDAVIGVHVNYLPHRPVDDTDGFTAEEIRRVEHIRAFVAAFPGYMRLQATRPQTIGYSLADSPVGQLTWIADKVKDWTDPRTPLSDDTLLTLVSMHWFFGTGGSSARLTFESGGPAGTVPCPAPLGMAVFAHDIILPVESVSRKAQPMLRHWSEFADGGHFAALEVPELLVGDVRKFFAALV